MPSAPAIRRILPTAIVYNDAVAKTVPLVHTNSSRGGGGAVGFKKQNINSLYLTGANTYTGPTYVNNGVLGIGTGGVIGSLNPASNIFITPNGTLYLYRSDGLTQGSDFGIIREGGGGVTNLLGTNTLNLLNLYTGQTAINVGTLRVNTISNGGIPCALGAASSLEINIYIAATLQYYGTGDTTNRLFRIGVGAATIDSSGSGPLVFNNTGSAGFGGSNTARTFTLAGNNTGENSLALAIGNNGTGATSLSKTGAGLWIVSGTATYTGTINVVAGILQIAKTSALYNTTLASWIPSNITTQNGATLLFSVGGTGEFTTSHIGTILTNLFTINNNGFFSRSNIGFDTKNASGGTFTISNIIPDSTGSGSGIIYVRKYGVGTLILSAACTFTGGMTIYGGTLKGGITNSIISTLTVNSGTVFDIGGYAHSLGAVINNGTVTNSGSSALLTIGAGSLGSGNYTGSLDLIWDQGIANSTFTGSFSNIGNITLNANGVGYITLTTGSLNNTGTITNSGSGSATVTINNVVGSNVTNIIQNSTTSQLTLLGNNTTYIGGVQITQGLFYLGSLAGAGTGPITLGSVGGSGNSQLSMASTNPTNNIIVNSGSGTRTITQNSGGNPNMTGSLTLYNDLIVDSTTAAHGISFLGTITGSNSIIVRSSNSSGGSVTIASTGTSFTGTIQVDPNGNFVAGNSPLTNLPSATVNVKNGGIFSSANGIPTIGGLNGDAGSITSLPVTKGVIIGGSGTYTYSGVIQNNASLTIVLTGSGSQTLNGINTYTGGTVINSGILSVTGSTASGNATSISGGKLMGSGTVAGTVTVANVAGSIIQGGIGGSETLNTGQLTFNGALSRLYVTSTTSAMSNINVTGNVALGGCGINFSAGITANGTYNLIVASGIMSGTLPIISTNSTGKTLVISQVGNILQVTVS